MTWIRQRVPFHRSASGRKVPALLKEIPEAVQALGELHDTPMKKLSLAPGGLGVARMRQLAPFQASAKVTPVLVLFWCSPTAMQAAGRVQEMARSAPFRLIALGSGPTRHEPLPGTVDEAAGRLGAKI